MHSELPTSGLPSSRYVNSEWQPLAVYPSTKWVNCTECWFWRHAHINKLWTETTNGTAPICWFWRHAHINKLCRRTRQKQQMARHPFVDLPDGSTIQIVDSAPILIFLVIPKQQSGSRVLYVYDKVVFAIENWPWTYLIFVISFTRAKFLENKIYTGKRID